MEWDYLFLSINIGLYLWILFKCLTVRSSYLAEKGRYEKKIQYLNRISVISLFKCLAISTYFIAPEMLPKILNSFTSVSWSIAFYIPIMIFINLSDKTREKNSSIKNTIKFFIMVCCVGVAVITFVSIKNHQTENLKYLDLIICLQFLGFAVLYMIYGYSINEKLNSMDQNEEKVKYLKEKIGFQIIFSTSLMILRSAFGVLVVLKLVTLSGIANDAVRNFFEFSIVYATLIEGKSTSSQTDRSGYELRKVLIDEERHN